MKWYLKALKNYVGFSGRARRKEYWSFVMFTVIISVLLGAATAAAGIVGAMQDLGILVTVASILGAVSGLFGLAMILPGLAVSIRRLHDIDKSGWFILIGIIPLIGPIILLVFTVSNGTEGDNRFGEDPKALDL